MSQIDHLLTQPLVITPYTDTGIVDGYGNATLTAGAPVNVLGYLFQQDSTETLVDRDTIVSGWYAFLPAGTALGPHDQIAFNSQSFQVDGVPMFEWNPRTSLIDHIECKLVVVQG